jgi:hypothetical protein
LSPTLNLSSLQPPIMSFILLMIFPRFSSYRKNPDFNIKLGT